jgi:hypothetical protein
VHSCDTAIAEGQMFGLHFPPVWAFTLAAHCAEIPGIRFKLLDDRVQGLEEAGESDVFLYSGLNQDSHAILANRAALAQRYPKAVHCLGGPITWSFRQANKLDTLDAFDHLFIGDGEDALPAFLRKWRENIPQGKILEAPQRFELSRARPMHQGLMRSSRGSYYGGVIEVSRGCPFLCEFCDIRVMPDNNRSHGKPASLIVAEVENLVKLGVSQIILACDNFIGNSLWAEGVCDSLIAWKEKTGENPGFYTWLSIDLSRHPRLMEKIRRAGIDMLFIGVESFSRNSLLETAKVQNTTLDMVQEIRRIQSHGLIVVAGLIFGFDTDPDDVVELTLNGIRSAGLISGDPSLLTALPGTPLYLRMKLSHRLRDGKIGLGGKKYQTNIQYLKPVEQMTADFLSFVSAFNAGSFQYARLLSFLSCLGPDSQGSKPESSARGFGNLQAAMQMVVRNQRTAFLLAKRFLGLFFSRDRCIHITKAYLYTRAQKSLGPRRWIYFKFWLVSWSNTVLKYSRLSPRDFDIGTVGADFSVDSLVPEAYGTTLFEPIPLHKVKMQRKNTSEQLKRLAREREIASAPLGGLR